MADKILKWIRCPVCGNKIRLQIREDMELKDFPFYCLKCRQESLFLVYFAQTTSVRLDSLDEQAMRILDYSRGGLFFNYDLLGYGMMALSTFFVGLTIDTKTKADKWLKYLLLIHGVFFISCFIMPMTGIFSSMSNGENNMGRVIALEFWCAYFTPIGILSFIHFRKSNM